MSGVLVAVLVDGLGGVVGDVDLPALVLQRHPDEIGQRAFVVDKQHSDRRSIRPVHPGQLAEDGATGSRAAVTDRRGGHLPIVTTSQRIVTVLIENAHVAAPD